MQLEKIDTHVGAQKVEIYLYLTRIKDLKYVFVMGDILLSLTWVSSYDKYILKQYHPTAGEPKDVCLKCKLELH